MSLVIERYCSLSGEQGFYENDVPLQKKMTRVLSEERTGERMCGLGEKKLRGMTSMEILRKSDSLMYSFLRGGGTGNKVLEFTLKY